MQQKLFCTILKYKIFKWRKEIYFVGVVYLGCVFRVIVLHKGNILPNNCTSMLTALVFKIWK
jgi:hypothetical protein